MEQETINLGVAGRTTSHFITLARIPITRLEPMEGQRTLTQSTLDGIYAGLTEENAPMRDINPLSVILTNGDMMEDLKRRLSEHRLDRVLSFEGIPEEYKLKVYSGFHRFTAATRYVEEHQNDPKPPTAAMRSWLCAVYDADVSDDPDLAVLMVAHNIEGVRGGASAREWIQSIQFSGDDKDRIKTAIGLTAHGPMVSSLCTVRLGMIWQRLVEYGTSVFNTTLSLSIIASWAAYCAEFEILELLLKDGLRQQEIISKMKKDQTPATPFDIFGQVWGENGHKQSGDKENVKKDWQKAKIRAFGKVDSTYTFAAFWAKATMDENGKDYVFGKVILVPEDLRADPKGGKRKDMAGYMVLTRARVALSALSTMLFAGDFEYRTLRTSSATPDPWVSTIMEKAGVDQSHVEQFIRDLVSRLGTLVLESQMKKDLPHQTACDVFKRKGQSAEALCQMVWSEVTNKAGHTAWSKFLDRCEEVYGFERNQELWYTITTMLEGKINPRKSARQKTLEAAAGQKKPGQSAAKPTGKKGGLKRHPSAEYSSIDSDDEVVFPVRKQRAAKQSTSKADGPRETSRQSDRLAAMQTPAPIEDEEEEEEEEQEKKAEQKDEDGKGDDEEDDEDEEGNEDDEDEDDEDKEGNEGEDDEEDKDEDEEEDEDDKMEEENPRGRQQRDDIGTHMDEDKPDDAMDEQEDSSMRNAQEDQDEDVHMEDDGRYDEPAMEGYESDLGDDSLAVVKHLFEDHIATGENRDKTSDKMADQPRGYSSLSNPSLPLTNPSIAMIAQQSISTHSTTFPTSVLRSEAGTHATSPVVPSALPITPILPAIHTVSAGQTATIIPPHSTIMTTHAATPTAPTAPPSTPALGEDSMVLVEPRNKEEQDIGLKIIQTMNTVNIEVGRWEESGNAQRAWDLLRSLEEKLIAGP